jgi:hypothetical protein
MSTYNAIAWLPLCAGLTGIGLVASWFAMRRRGLAAGLRGVAWSLLPLAAYLTGSIKMFWKIGSAIGDFATSFVFNPQVWSGVGVALLAAVLFVVSGAGKRRRKRARVKAAGDVPAGLAAADGAAAQNGKAPGKAPARNELATRPARGGRAGKGALDDDDDLAGVEDILRKHGIT